MVFIVEYIVYLYASVSVCVFLVCVIISNRGVHAFVLVWLFKFGGLQHFCFLFLSSSCARMVAKLREYLILFSVHYFYFIFCLTI